MTADASKRALASCVKKLAGTLKGDVTWAILLIAIAGVATAAITMLLLTKGVYPHQQQYRHASQIADQLRATGYETCLGSFEDGDSPDGCCVTAKDNIGRVKLDVSEKGEVTAVTYRVYIEDIDEIDAARTQSALVDLISAVQRTCSEIKPTVEQMQTDAAHLNKGLKTQKVASARINVGGSEMERVYRYENCKTYGWLVASVKAPPKDTQSNSKESSKYKKAKTKLSKNKSGK